MIIAWCGRNTCKVYTVFVLAPPGQAQGHSPAFSYDTFGPTEAWRLSQKLETYYTPTHGSWLNMAEIELSVLSRLSLADRMASMQEAQQQVQAWQQQRNLDQVTINWRFSTEDARIEIKRLYPSLEP